MNKPMTSKEMEDWVDKTWDDCLNQPEALRLADWLEADACDLQTPRDAAAELRRLFEHAHDQHSEIYGLRAKTRRLEMQNAKLLEALQCVIDDLMYKDHARVIDAARAAIEQYHA